MSKKRSKREVEVELGEASARVRAGLAAQEAAAMWVMRGGGDQAAYRRISDQVKREIRHVEDLEREWGNW